MTPLRLGYPGGTGDAEATTLLRGIISPDGDDLLRRQQICRGDPFRSPRPAHLRLLQVMMLPTLLISRKMVFGGNPSCARVVCI
jgi:hypothetical protein